MKAPLLVPTLSPFGLVGWWMWRHADRVEQVNGRLASTHKAAARQVRWVYLGREAAVLRGGGSVVVFAVADGGAPLLQVTRKPNSICRHGRALTKRKEPRDARTGPSFRTSIAFNLHMLHNFQLHSSLKLSAVLRIARPIKSHSFWNWKH